jgi:hypothetical protein
MSQLPQVAQAPQGSQVAAVERTQSPPPRPAQVNVGEIICEIASGISSLLPVARSPSMTAASLRRYMLRQHDITQSPEIATSCLRRVHSRTQVVPPHDKGQLGMASATKFEASRSEAPSINRLQSKPRPRCRTGTSAMQTQASKQLASPREFVYFIRAVRLLRLACSYSLFSGSVP